MSGANKSKAANELALMAERDLDAPIAWRAGAPVSGHAFLGAAARIAAGLPGAGRPINLCQDRLHFALGLAAALLRGQTSLMPPNALPATLRQLPADGAPPYVMADPVAIADGLGVGGLPMVTIDFDAISADRSGGGPAAQGQAAARAPTPVPRISSRLEAVCLLTSGSTGAPQPHAKHFGALSANIAAEAARLAEWLRRPTLHGLNIVATVPPQHSYGLESSVLLALLGGASFDAGRPFYPADIAAALVRLPRPRALVTTPFHLKALLQSGVALPPVDLVLSATAPLSPQLAAQAEAAMGGCLGEIYGCTEAGQVAARRTTQGDLWTTLGELRISREAVALGHPGHPGDEGDGGDEGGEGRERFVVSGGHVIEPTPLADLLELHDARHFRLLGRANDLIHVAGKRSSLAHLNFHLNRIDGVEDGAFWLPEPGDLLAPSAGPELEAVQRPMAFVVAPGLAARDIIAALRRELESAFVPRRVVHVSALPREATGKLTVTALREWALETLAAAPAVRENAGRDAGSTRDHRHHRAGSDAGPDTEDEYPIRADHPALAGHFPGQPLLPGVVLLSLVLRSLERRAALRARLGKTLAIEQVKFLAPVGADERVRVQLRPLARAHGGAIAFECRVGDRIAARGQLGPGRAP